MPAKMVAAMIWAKRVRMRILSVSTRNGYVYMFIVTLMYKFVNTHLLN